MDTASLTQVKAITLAEVACELRRMVERGSGIDLDEKQRYGVLKKMRKILALEWRLVPDRSDQQVLIPRAKVLAGVELSDVVEAAKIPDIEDTLQGWANDLLAGTCIEVVVCENGMVRLPHEYPERGSALEGRIVDKINYGITGL